MTIIPESKQKNKNSSGGTKIETNLRTYRGADTFFISRRRFFDESISNLVEQ